MFAGLMVAIFGKMFDMRWLAYLGLAVMMTGAFVIAAYGFLRETRPHRRAHPGIAPPVVRTSVEKADTTNKLLPVGNDDYIPSVVEESTELLKSRLER
jgi:hypothetical protein